MMLSPCYCQPLDQLDYSISHKMPNDYIPENIENLDLGWAAGLGWAVGLGCNAKKISINELQTAHKKFHGC